MKKREEIIQNIEAELTRERPQLVHFCTRLTGDAHVAEDLVQETLLEAWRHLEGLREPEKLSPWLSGIARNVYLRWARKRSRERANTVDLASGKNEIEIEETLADDFDLEIELEQREMAELLDRAMELLPPDTRTYLLERYVRESSLTEVASLMGVNMQTASMRLKRGKLALRRVLIDEFKLETETYAPNEHATWKQLDIWCHHCGQQRLLGKFDPERGDLYLKCLSCCQETNDYVSLNTGIDFLVGFKTFKPAIARIEKWAGVYYRTALHEGSVPCLYCRRPVPLDFGPPEDASSWMRKRSAPIIHLFCGYCDTRCYTSMDSLIFDLPEVQDFRKKYPRIQLLPPRYIEAEGVPTLVATCASVTSTAKIEVVATLERFDVLNIYGG